MEAASAGINFEYGLPNLLDLRFADDIVLFCSSADEAISMLDSLLETLSEVGLVLNSKKTNYFDK